MIEHWQQQIKEAAARGAKLMPRGGGTKSFLASVNAGDALDTRAYAGIVEYDPKELVIVVRCGTPLVNVEKTMADAGQMLAFEPPHFGEGATIGGAVATGLSGPRRAYAGSVRDFVLGTKVIDGKGDHLSFGGKVMKNVAGFDVSRLLTGSFGTLGIITEVAFKCLPLPKAQATRVFEMNAKDAIEKMNRWYAEANPITATTWVDGKLYVRLAGAAPAVQTAIEKLGGEALANDVAWWADWCEQKHAFFSSNEILFRVSCKSTAPAFDIGREAIDWGGAQRWIYASLDDAAKLRYAAKQHGGFLQVFRGGVDAHDADTKLQPVLAEIHSKIKASFDPYNVFCSLSRSAGEGARQGG
jgi:glycolate oxidase FAD binding subunit